MNSTSHYKQIIKSNFNNKNSNAKKGLKIKLTEPEQFYIKLQSPNIEKKSTCVKYKYKYPILNHLKTDINSISKNIKHISFCIYRILHCKSHENVKHPFLQYLLFKYSKSNMSDLMVFPFLKKKKNVIHESKQFIKNLINKDIQIKGYIEKKDTVFLFYDFSSYYKKMTNKVYFMKRDQSLWWCIIDEICNHKKVINFPIHKSVTSLFLENPSFIYLKLNNLNIEIPSIAYYGNYFGSLPMVAGLGRELQRENIYLGTFRKAIRDGVWTPNYEKKSIYGNEISDINGKYYKGGIIRYAIFLGKTKILNDINHTSLKEISVKKEWKNNFQSIFISEIKFDKKLLTNEPEYILKNINQQTPLSYHEIDSKKLPLHWEESYKDYNIV